MKKLSIITVCLNDREGLRKTITSVEQQTFRDFEFIIVDGGSTDGSEKLPGEFNSVVTIWISEKDRGIYHAQNKGIGLATGEYCLFLNAGDCLADPDALEKIFAVKSNADILYGDLYLDHGDGKRILAKSPAKISQLHLLKDTLWHPVSFIRRNLFEQFGRYDEQFSIVADYEFFVRVIAGKKISTQYIPVPISVFDTQGISGRADYREKLEEERRIVQDKYLNPWLVRIFRLYSKLVN